MFYLTLASLTGILRVSRRDSNSHPRTTIPIEAHLSDHTSFYVKEISTEISNSAIVRNWETIVRVPLRELEIYG